MTTPFYADDWLALYGGDCRTVLSELPADSVDCVVTSPPYWGLRDYGTATWEGGDEGCDHVDPDWQARVVNSPKQQTQVGSYQRQELNACRKCGATRVDSQLGLERTPEEYVAHMVEVFREVRRVLKPTGTCWLNLGDSYASGGTGGASDKSRLNGGRGVGPMEKLKQGPTITRAAPAGLKPKDLVGIPWRVAFALQADGWYLRSDIIWSKPNPMPESVTDRPTKSHEYLFLLTKSARYYFDADAVRESFADKRMGNPGAYKWSYAADPDTGRGVRGAGGPSTKLQAEGWNVDGAKAGRNIRSVWSIATRPYPGAHFAVFPPELPERCIKAGSSERGVCPETGEPWERVVEKGERFDPAKYSHRSTKDTTEATGRNDVGGTVDKSNGQEWAKWKAENPDKQLGWRPTCGAPWERVVERRGTGPKFAPLAIEESGALPDGPGTHRNMGGRYQKWLDANPPQTTGWSTTCEHTSSTPVPAVVLDPFGGSGTVGMVANRLSRRAILIDLNPEYLKQQMTRNAQTPLGLTEGDAA